MKDIRDILSEGLVARGTKNISSVQSRLRTLLVKDLFGDSEGRGDVAKFRTAVRDIAIALDAFDGNGVAKITRGQEFSIKELENNDDIILCVYKPQEEGSTGRNISDMLFLFRPKKDEYAHIFPNGRYINVFSYDDPDPMGVLYPVGDRLEFLFSLIYDNSGNPYHNNRLAIIHKGSPLYKWACDLADMILDRKYN